MERIHRPNSVEPYRGILVQRCRPSLCLCRVVFGITAKEGRPASVELMSRARRVGGKCNKPISSIVLLSQKVAAVVEMNHVSGEIHFSACEGLRWVCQDQVTRRRGLRRMSRV
jgi:hypothetical protein